MAGDPAGYETAADARKVTGEASSADAPEIRPGSYTDAISAGEKLYYGVSLDGRSGAFLSAVVAPKAGTPLDHRDGVEVSLRKTDGDECAGGKVRFGSGRTARPIAASADRVIEEGGDCQKAGRYFLVVERVGDSAAGARSWPVEIRYMSEPGLRGGASAKGDGRRMVPPTGRRSAPPVPPTGKGTVRRGGTGFNDAPAVGGGVWRDAARPGETRFYRVPLEWGQRLSATVELANAVPRGGRSGYASGGLGAELYNTARGRVVSGSTGYDGQGAVLSLGPTAPVAYENRFGVADDEAAAMRFAGWYYLAITFGAEAAELTDEPVRLTLRLTVDGEAESGPPYAGAAAAAGFGVSERDREAAERGWTAEESGGGGESGAEGLSGTRRLVAVAGIGSGTALLLGLGAWRLVARRRYEVRGRASR
ncbi:hypothetical protein ACH429_10005 [Streptomyces pathocidini]|uniref:Uncharacterized protein n=2 Tax=Streptomyces pathocidini TaxID=1650571 RepID=A0ABW7USF0_9ACTN